MAFWMALLEAGSWAGSTICFPVRVQQCERGRSPYPPGLGVGARKQVFVAALAIVTAEGA